MQNHPMVLEEDVDDGVGGEGVLATLGGLFIGGSVD